MTAAALGLEMAAAWALWIAAVQEQEQAGLLTRNQERKLARLPMKNQREESAGPSAENQEQKSAGLLMGNQKPAEDQTGLMASL